MSVDPRYTENIDPVYGYQAPKPRSIPTPQPPDMFSKEYHLMQVEKAKQVERRWRVEMLRLLVGATFIILLMFFLISIAISAGV